MKYPPRPGDLPREELISAANKVLEESTVPVDLCFKFTCEHCGERCTFQEPNMLYEKGECHKCGKETTVKFGGYSLHFHYHKLKEQQNN